MLIEIKTGVSAQDIYGAVGQLTLYPLLIKLPAGLERVLLIPGEPPLRQAMASALEIARVSVYTYSIGRVGEKPVITFAKQFLERCRLQKL